MGRKKEETVEAYTEQIYSQANKTTKEKFDTYGLHVFTHGGRNNAFGALMQCFM